MAVSSRCPRRPPGPPSYDRRVPSPCTGIGGASEGIETGRTGGRSKMAVPNPPQALETRDG